jgi:LysR family transcriptional regulator, nitrogen assimilation regulatory protein
MELRQLRYFAKIAELGSFTAAANILNVTQPTLGVQIKNLEDEIGLKLFARHSRGVSLTDAGSIYFSHVQDILRRIKVASEAIDHLKQSVVKPIRIGAIPSIGIAAAPQLMESSRLTLPDLDISFLVDFTENLNESLQAGDIDFSLSYSPIQDAAFESFPLFLEQIWLVGSPTLFGKLPNAVPFAKAAEMPLVLDKFSLAWRMAEDLDVPLGDTLLVRSMMVRQQMVANGQRGVIGPYVFMLQQIQDGIVNCHEIEDPKIWCRLYLNSRADGDLSDSERAVSSLIKLQIGGMIEKGEYRWIHPDAYETRDNKGIDENYIMY